MATDRYEAEVTRVDVDGRVAWRKRYGAGSRRVRLFALDVVARTLGLGALRPPPRHSGQAARVLEQQRIATLSSAGIRVPEVLLAHDDVLVLGDLGETLPAHLKRADAAGAERLFHAAAAAVAGVHASGHYLGQPLPRNITIDAGGRIGFIDFEEDPGEVMDLTRAQARDWLVFCSGVARHVRFDERRMADLLGVSLGQATPAVRRELRDSVRRLGFLRVLTRPLGRRAASLGKAVASLQQALASE